MSLPDGRGLLLFDAAAGMYREALCDGTGQLLVAGGTGGSGSGGSTGLTDAQLRATSVAVSGPLTDGQLRAAAVAVSGPVTDAQMRAAALPVASVDLGVKADTRATWYDSAASLVALLKLSIAAYIGAGSHAYGYNGSGQLTTDAWTLFGTTRTKTYTYTSGVLTAESDWV